MNSSNTIEVLKRGLKLAHNNHVSRLLAIPQSHLDSISPRGGFSIQDLLTRYNAQVDAELGRYGDQLQAEVTAVLEGTKGSSVVPSRDTVISLVDEFLHPGLYKKRFSIFRQAIERRIQGFGVAFNLGEHRVDIPESMATIGAENRCRTIRSRIANSVDKLYLGFPQREPTQQTARWYTAINRIHNEHPALFWLIGLAVSVVGILIAL